MHKFFLGGLTVAFLFLPSFVNAESAKNEEIFTARVIKILEERELTREDGSKNLQQNILLRGVEGAWKSKEMTFYGISDLDVIKSNIYKVGDKVLVSHLSDVGGQDKFFIIDFVRTGYLYFLALFFAVVIVAVGKKRGLRALLSLILSFLVILKFIIPKILSGGNPLMITLLGALIMIATIIYLTEGWGMKSHIGVISVMMALAITLFLTLFFSALARLTGLGQEETAFLINIGAKAMDFRGLLLAGVIIGVLGVLDDVIISQVEAVWQIKKANPELGFGQIFKGAYEVGNAHLGSVVNTLFLTYVGASLPLLLLFSADIEPALSLTQIINNEMMATEIVRTLVGSIGLALSVPLTTFLASAWVSKYGAGDKFEEKVSHH